MPDSRRTTRAHEADNVRHQSSRKAPHQHRHSNNIEFVLPPTPWSNALHEQFQHATTQAQRPCDSETTLENPHHLFATGHGRQERECDVDLHEGCSVQTRIHNNSSPFAELQSLPLGVSQLEHRVGDTSQG
eukprot:CAMPEP_0194530972 /NCGR_PEP_ID=MMETSP0253-20130528/68135_1 /TAXON_ID=2966 /ORGANISM="Noctiluca scintillans" /LENGTH=130 /DNA_ID=CAMNT_0039376277 /DNA_START=417 /DNA_END=809 /DNA_ORIENTATION=+